MKEKSEYEAVWISHSSLGDFIKCPRAYYLHNVYRDPKTRNKIAITSPSLSLGSAVHEVIEGLSKYKVNERANVPLLSIFENVWKKVSGKRGGFLSADDENQFKERGVKMIKRVMNNMEPLLYKTIKIGKNSGKENEILPHYWLSKEENIILCGKIDWLQYIENDDSLRIIDFKTGINEEKEGSLQLPIYELLLSNLQKRKVSGAAYWYLERDDSPKPVNLLGVDKAYKSIFPLALKIKNARKENVFLCKNGPNKSCYACEPYEKIIRKEAEFVGVGEYRQDIYLV